MAAENILFIFRYGNFHFILLSLNNKKKNFATNSTTKWKIPNNHDSLLALFFKGFSTCLSRQLDAIRTRLFGEGKQIIVKSLNVFGCERKEEKVAKLLSNFQV